MLCIDYFFRRVGELFRGVLRSMESSGRFAGYAEPETKTSEFVGNLFKIVYFKLFFTVIVIKNSNFLSYHKLFWGHVANVGSIEE